MRVALLLILVTGSAFALPVHETYSVKGVPSLETILDWSAHAGQRSYVIRIDDPWAGDLETLAHLQNFDSLQIETSHYPSENTVPEFTRLAQKGATWVGLNVPPPNDDEIRRLNQIGFKRIHFLLTAYLGREEAERLARLKSKVRVTFAVRAYPRFEDKEGLQALPSGILLGWASDYWPWYSHMDLLNLLPHAKRLRVVDSFPPQDELQYLTHIRDLEELTLDTDREPPFLQDRSSLWLALGAIPVNWSFRGSVLGEAILTAYEKSAQNNPRRLTFETTDAPSPAWLSRLDRSPLPVEWVRLIR